MLNKVLVTLDLRENERDLIQNASKNCSFTFVPKNEVTREMVQSADIILGNVPAGMIEQSPKLKFLQLNTTGADEYCKEGILHQDTLLASCTGAYGLAVSEHMLAMHLALIKRLHQYRDNQLQSLWHDEGNVTSVEGSTVLIFGLGDIGSEYAKKVKALGAYTIGVKKNLSQKPDYLDELVLFEDFRSVLGRADVIALILPSTPETIRLFDEQVISSCKQGVVLLNMGRGNVFDTDALIKALETGHVSAFGADVTDPEPLPSDHKLWTIRNAMITPHVSGFFHLEETRRRVIARVIENLKNFEQGLPLISVIDRSTGYRKHQQ